MTKKTEKWVYETPKNDNFVIQDTLENLKKIEELAVLGLSIEQIGNYFGVCENTFRTLYKKKFNFKRAYNRGRSVGIVDVATALMRQIQSGDVKAIIFYLKSHAGWNDDSKKDSGGDSEIDKTTVTINVSDPIEAARLYQEIMRGEK